MIAFDGICFNEPISRRIMAELESHDPSYAELPQDQVPRRVTRFCFMSALAKLNGLSFFPRVAELCDGTLLARCDARIMSRGLFMPLCLGDQDTLIVAVADPWNPLPQTYLAPRFPTLMIVRIVTLVPEITRTIATIMLDNGFKRRTRALTSHGP